LPPLQPPLIPSPLGAHGGSSGLAEQVAAKRAQLRRASSFGSAREARARTGTRGEAEAEGEGGEGGEGDGGGGGGVLSSLMKELMSGHTRLKPVERRPLSRRASTGSCNEALLAGAGGSSVEAQLHVELEKAMRKRRGHMKTPLLQPEFGEASSDDDDSKAWL
jgi:hypothetical protein